MVDKRLRKLKEIEMEISSTRISWAVQNIKHLVIGWGSTYGPIKEALENLKE